ncbi:MAG: YesL family protein [Lachnospiraceae bacterium]|nr:YesL family protein [Lachnospiraceae bacterium]
MGKLFSTESNIYQKLSKWANVLLCGFAWLLCCIPIITIGASCTAMYRMMFNIRDDKPAGFGPFFTVFGKEFAKSTLIWLCDLLCVFILYIIFGYTASVGISDTKGILTFVLFLLPFFIWMFTFLYVFALNSFFENTVLNTIRNGLVMSFRYYRYSILSMAVTVIPFFLYMFLGDYYFLLYGLPILIFVLLPLIMYWKSGFFLKVFENFVPKKEETIKSEN